jgi:hypothetical protein
MARKIGIAFVLLVWPIVWANEKPGTAAAMPQDKWVIFKFAGDMCKSPPNGWEIHGDFDGNGKKDIARLEDNAQQKKRRLAVWLNGAGTPVVLEENILRSASDYLSVKAPGVFEPFIDSTDKTPVKVEFEAIATGTCESSEVIYYWDKATKKFKQVWTGD